VALRYRVTDLHSWETAEQSQSGAILGEGGGEEGGKVAISNFKPEISNGCGAAANPESEHLAANTSSDPPSGGARMISSNQ